MTMTYGQGHPGEDATRLGIYTKHRVITLFRYGLGIACIADYLKLPAFVVEAVIREEVDEEGSRAF